MRKLLVALLAVGLLGAAGFAYYSETPPSLSRWSIGLGTGFQGASPMFDGFLQLDLIPYYLDARIATSVVRLSDPTEVWVFATLLATPTLHDVGFYVGAGVGGFIEADEGVATAVFAAEALAGMEVAFTRTLRFFIQTRFLGSFSDGEIEGWIIPGFGLRLSL